MNLMKYEDVLALCKDSVNEIKAPFRAREMSKKAELEVCKLESAIADREQKIQDLSCEYPIKFDKLIEAIDDLELTIRRKEQFEIIIKDMFSE